MAIAVSQALQPQNSKWETKFNYLPESKTSKREIIQMQISRLLGPKVPKRAFPGPVTKHRSRKVILYQSQRESGTSALEMALLDVWSSPGILAAPLNEMIISIQEPWMVLDVADDKINVLIYTGTITLPWSLTLGHFNPKTLLWLQLWKVSHSLLHWISHLPIWTTFDFTCLFCCAWVSYYTTRKRSSGLPWSHVTIMTSLAVPFLDSD